jgi:ketosteroid isomerase-like protein
LRGSGAAVGISGRPAAGPEHSARPWPWPPHLFTFHHTLHFVDEGAQTGISKWTLTGTRPDGRRIEVWGCDFYTFRDGKVVRKDPYWNIVG